MMVKHTPAISVLYSVRVTLTNHYWVTSDERRRQEHHEPFCLDFPFLVVRERAAPGDCAICFQTNERTGYDDPTYLLSKNPQGKGL